MKLIYVAGKYRAKTENEIFENIIAARKIARRLWEEGWAVICPHANTMFMGGIADDSAFLEGDLEMIRRCDAIYMMNNWWESVGATKELALARELKIQIIANDPLGDL